MALSANARGFVEYIDPDTVFPPWWFSFGTGTHTDTRYFCRKR